ncbi:serine/threonine-protein kinase [Nocardioides rubriscoriae]|uniref:serine/threonine-protein kinase n=1 Tax=Nocardioides rubriscoriae TaxID=642762 RepID=UPI001FE619DF|nr:serine/threonine-protein kinase [Nocardioides rubriscoriae]
MPYADPPLAGRYHLLEVVGSGAMGAVWRAWDLREQRFVAVKVLRRHDGDHLLRFVREQSLRITHPHVTAPTGWAADDDRVALVMELARGGSLADLLADRRGEPLTASYVAELLDQLLDGLAAVHAAGVVHRDLKPANLLLEPTGRGRPHLRIGDFGVAALLGHPAEPGVTSVGTTGYAAPEQLGGAAPDPRQDLFAAGSTARRLLGRAPSPLDPLVAALCARDPARRPASAREARARLAALGLSRPWHRPRVPDRLGEPATLPVPAARRPPAPVPSAAPGWLLAASFAASGAGASLVVLGLTGR